MRVLMFGWEFPPHISGGLGTACFGLSQSLVRQNIELFFVVPTLFGNENSQDVQLINASKITIPFAGRLAEKEKVTIKKTVQEYIPGKIKLRKEKSASQFSYIEVSSSLNPYNSATCEEKIWSVENWNYVLENIAPQTIEKEINDVVEFDAKPVGYQYKFSGSYGQQLMKEVDEYSLVGRELGKQFQHDVIHAHDWMTFPAALEAKKISGKPLVVHVHSTEIDRSGSGEGPVYEIEKRAMNAADKIVAVSQWTRQIIIKRYYVAPEKILVVHNGILRSDQPVMEDQSPLGSQMITFLGRITHQKGPGYFVEAARKVSRSFPDAHFIVAGSGDLLPQTIERVAQLRMSNKFHFTGFLNKEWISRIWAMTDVYVMPSVSEPFGITPLEAIQAGVPVIVSNQSGVAEVMEHALKVNFWDTEALAESICSVLKYKSLSSMLKKGGEKEVMQISWQKAASKIKSLYEELHP